MTTPPKTTPPDEAGFFALTDDERERAVAALSVLKERAPHHPAFSEEDREFIAAQFAMARGGVMRRDALLHVAELSTRLGVAEGGG